MSGTGVQDPITNQLSEHAHDNNLSSDNVGNPTYRKPLSEQSTNIVPEKATASKKEQLTKPKKQDSTSKGKEKAHEENTAEDEVVLLTDEERIRIYKKKNHWDRALYGGLYWDDDLKTWEAQEDVLEDHSFVLRGFAAEVADEGDDNETVIAKLKAAGGWFGDLTLRGEETKTVPIYDTCIRLKEKITDFLGKDNKKPENLGVLRSNAGENITYPLKKGDFASAIGSKTASLNGFMKKQGVMGGAENGTCSHILICNCSGVELSSDG